MAYYALKKDVFDINKVTVVGSPTITSDGVASGFSGSDYVYRSISVNSNNVKLKFSFNYKSSENQQVWFKFSGAPTANNLTNLEFGKFGGTNNMYIRATVNGTANTYIYATNSFSKTWADGDLIECEFDLHIDNFKGQILNKTQSTVGNINYIYATNELSFNAVNIGGYGVAGTINLPSFKIYVDNQLVLQPVKPAYLLERRKEGYDPSKFTIVGSPAITKDGVASGFSKGGHLASPFILSEYTTFEIKITLDLPIEEPLYSSIVPFTMAIDGRNFIQLMFTKANLGTRFVLVSDFTNLDSSTVTNSWQYGEKNVEYSLGYDGTFYYFKKNGFLLKQFSVDYKVPTDNFTLYFGTAVNNFDWFFNGSINLPSTSITVDGIEVFTGAKENYYMLSV